MKQRLWTRTAQVMAGLALLTLTAGTIRAAEKFEFNLGWIPFGRDVA